jgi:DNA (cytosine-5)-methyltransferase 1
MRAPVLRLHADELIVDSFAGGGGASLGMEWALGRSPDIAINHNADAIATHAMNHPNTRHYCEDVWKVDPVEATGGRPVGMMWLSPDCKHFSKAKGGKPVEKRIRGLAWIAVRWARAVKPRVIVLENVEEFAGWGPVGEDGKPCPARRGITFRRFVGSLRAAGYVVDWRELVAADYGTPTTRRRLFLVARSDGAPIRWPAPTHGRGLEPYRTAAECIDWSLPCPSIFDRDRPLADATMRRIAAGVMRYVVNDPRSFVVNMAHGGKVEDSRRPFSTIATERGGCRALVSPTLVQVGYGERAGQAPRVPGLHKPLGTCVTGQKHGLVAAFLAKHYGGHTTPGASLAGPMHTITTQDHHALVHALLLKYYGTDQDPQMLEPPHTITTKHRFGLVMVSGEPHYIGDIGMRMLQPRELYRAQGFPDTYIIDRTVDGRELTKTAQVRMCGNSVCPPVAAAVVAAQFSSQAITDDLFAEVA